jgi:hypothetical protein
MKRQVLQPFRAPRSRGDTTQERVHRKDNSARFKEMEKWMDKNLAGEGVGVKAKTSATRQPPRGKDKQDREVHLVPFR